MQKENNSFTKKIVGKTKEEFKERVVNFVNSFTVGSAMAQMFGTINGYCLKCTQDIDTLIQACEKDENGNYFVKAELEKVALVPWVNKYNFQNLPNEGRNR